MLLADRSAPRTLQNLIINLNHPVLKQYSLFASKLHELVHKNKYRPPINR